MKTEEDFYKDFADLKSGKEIELTHFAEWEYTNLPEELEILLTKLQVFVSLESLERKYFEGDKEKRTVLQVRIKRDNRQITFTFGCSIYDTELFNSVNTWGNEPYILRGKQYWNFSHFSIMFKKYKREFIKQLLCSILTCCRSDFYIPIDFDEFCSEFGYSNDSIQAKNIWESCLKQSSKLRKIFSTGEVECLPS